MTNNKSKENLNNSPSSPNKNTLREQAEYLRLGITGQTFDRRHNTIDPSQQPVSITLSPLIAPKSDIILHCGNQKYIIKKQYLQPSKSPSEPPPEQY